VLNIVSENRLVALSTRLATLGERSREIAEALIQLGFSAFLPYQNFIESFARNDEDLAKHRQYVTELAKGYLSLARILPVSAVASSEFLNKLKAEALKSELLTDKLTEWIPRFHMDPCEQNALAFKVRSEVEYLQRESAMLESRAAQLDIEAKRYTRFTAAESETFMQSRELRLELATKFIGDIAEKMGFETSGNKNVANEPVACRPIGGQLKLMLCLVDLELFFVSSREGQVFIEFIVGPGSARRVRKISRATQFATLQYRGVVYGFPTAYCSFANIAGLERNIEAQLSLVGILLPGIVEALESVPT